jgi:type I restriction enzyme S subunit
VSGFSVMSKEPSIIWAADRLINKRIDSNYYHIKYIEYLDTIVNCGLDCKPFEDICKRMNSGPFGSALLASAYVEKGVPFIRPLNCKNFIVEDNELVFISNEDSIRLKSSRFNSGALIITKIGNGIGDVAIIPRKNDKCNISGNLMGVEIKNSYDNYFVLSFLKSKYGQNQIWQGMMNSAKPKIDMDTIRSIQIPIPSAEIQKYIGDKVRRAEELREEAITLQKDIDILLEVDMLLEETDRINNIFHSKVNWTNEINIVDRIDPNFYQKKYRTTIEKLGDNKVELGELVKISKRRYQTGDINKYIEISSINNSFGTIDEVEELRPEEIPTSAKHQVKEGDILVSLVRPTRKAISIVTKEYDNAICTGGFAVLQSKGKVPVEFLTAVLRTNFAGIQFERYCTGSTYPTINENDVVKIFIPQYSEKQINKITEKYRRIIESIYRSKKLIQEAKQDVEDLIEGNFEMSKLNNDSSTESRC